MKKVKVEALPETIAMRLGLLGALLTDRFTARVGEFGLKPKHAALLNVLSLNGSASQMEIAKMLRVAPSLVVTLADHLESIGAIDRLRDPDDRRRQILTLTGRGTTLLMKCLDAACDIDDETTAGLTAADRTALHRILGVLADQSGLPS
jgi:DNA-binding MarR family transcriptional regulator